MAKTTLFSKLMENMGLDNEYLRQINDPSHEPLMDIDVLCANLHDIKSNNRKLVIYPDIDVDGLTSGTLGLAGFSELGFDVSLYIPDAAKGHGVYREDINQIVADHPDVAAIITCDTGIDSFDGVEAAHEHGVKIFVTDHHKEELGPDGSRLPADVIINPMRIDETYAHPQICGAFVLYQVLEEYTHRYAGDKIESILMLRLYAGIGTIADVMPLTYENREVVRASIGLLKLYYQQSEEVYDIDTLKPKTLLPDIDASLMMKIINSEEHHPAYVRAFRGVGAIVAGYSERDKVRGRTSLDEEFTAFYIAPMINAIRRMSNPIALGFSAFAGSDPIEHVRYLLDANDMRKKLQADCVETLLSTPQPLAPYVYTISGVRSGMLGLLANNMMEMSGMPTVVVSERHDGTYGGSGRSPGWYDFNSKINAFGFRARGHEHAFGVTIGTWDDMCQFYELISADSQNVADELRAKGETVDIPEADLVIGEGDDVHAPLNDLEAMLELGDQIKTLKPFGHGFRKPRIDVVSDARLVKSRTMGSENQHIALTNAMGLKMIAWNNSTTIPGLKKLIDESHEDDVILLHCMGDIERNEWKFTISANLMCNGIYAEVHRVDGSTERTVL